MTTQAVTVRAVVAAERGSVRGAARWWGAFVAAWVVGAIGGVAPTAFLGDPASGLVGAGLRGMVAVALVSPLLLAPLVASLVCDDDQHQVVVTWHTVGIGPARRMTARCLAAAGASVRLLVIGAVAGSLAGLGLAASGVDPFRVGPAGGPTPVEVLLAAVVLALSWVLGGLVGAWAVSTARAVMALLVSLLVTGAVAGLLYFVPGLRVLFWLTPWAALWPFDPDSFNSAQFARSVPVAVRLLSGAAWLAIVALAAARRRHRVPYPMPGEQHRRS